MKTFRKIIRLLSSFFNAIASVFPSRKRDNSEKEGGDE